MNSHLIMTSLNNSTLPDDPNTLSNPSCVLTKIIQIIRNYCTNNTDHILQ